MLNNIDLDNQTFFGLETKEEKHIYTEIERIGNVFNNTNTNIVSIIYDKIKNEFKHDNNKCILSLIYIFLEENLKEKRKKDIVKYSIYLKYEDKFRDALNLNYLNQNNENIYILFLSYFDMLIDKLISF